MYKDIERAFLEYSCERVVFFRICGAAVPDSYCYILVQSVLSDHAESLFSNNRHTYTTELAVQRRFLGIIDTLLLLNFGPLHMFDVSNTFECTTEVLTLLCPDRRSGEEEKERRRRY